MLCVVVVALGVCGLFVCSMHMLCEAVRLALHVQPLMLYELFMLILYELVMPLFWMLRRAPFEYVLREHPLLMFSEPWAIGNAASSVF